LEGSFVGGDDTDVAGCHLHDLDLSRAGAGEGDDFGTETADSGIVVGSFVDGEFGGWGRKRVYVNAVLERDHDARAGEAYGEDCCAEFEGEGGLTLFVVPDHHFVLGELGLFAATDESDIVGAPT
jgi:hypothetical protein